MYFCIGVQQPKENKVLGNSTNESAADDDATCQYEYMMRVSQPDVPCPNVSVMMGMLKKHTHLMSVSNEKAEMCHGMNLPSTMMVCMYIYHSLALLLKILA